jgi:lipopolysaccharide/colanic/teichoic acid biosynthesis glycosyltransferase
MQRLLDIVLSLAALCVLAPLLLPVALLLRLTGEGDVFYVQQRVGRDGRMFGLYKFATMLRDSPALGTGTITLKDDPRVLPVGRVLRKTKVNELPQLLNVLRGEMSIVGPRPQTPRCFGAFPPGAQASIKRVRPGLTGVGSLVFHDEEALMDGAVDPDRLYDTVIMPYKGRLEAWYVDNASVGIYLKIILLTAYVLAGGDRALVWTSLPGLPQPPAELHGAGATA